MPSISAILIAKDEERDLPGCLESLKGLATEIVVVVSDDTTDRTDEIAKSYGAKTFRRKFDDYARMRQASLDAATGDWCLWIDPDERATPALVTEIRQALAKDPDCDGFDIPFEVSFLGHTMRWGGLGHESHVRLFRREGSRFTGGALHEGIETKNGSIRSLEAKMTHIPYRDVADYMSKLERYTDLGAQKRFAAGKRFTVFHHLIYPWELFARVVLKLGFLDGGPGLTWARLSAYHSWLKYDKLRRMQEEKR
ncbi:MAG: glycosyltransferase family 2 protein [Elusimicrobiota bacterium]|nr:MAG: glycosyltransferase family 2 protein [Elusimicrobiota bacterium]